MLGLIIALALSASPAAAEPSKASVDKVLGYFQTDALLTPLAKDFEAAVARRRKEVTIAESRRRNVESLGRRIFPPKNLLKVFKQAYAKATTLENMNALYAWMNTPKGIKLRQGYAAFGKATPKQVKDYYEKDAPPVLKPNRRNAIQTFMTAWHQDELGAHAQAELDYAVLMAFNAYLPAGGRDTPKYLKEKALQHTSGFLERVRSTVFMNDAYVLKDLKNEDIDELSKFAQTPVGEAHTQAYYRAMEVTIEGAANTLVEQVIKGQK